MKSTRVRLKKKNDNYDHQHQQRIIRYKCSLHNTIADVMRNRPGWIEAKDGEIWDFYWCDVSWLRDNFDQKFLEEHVRISHYRNHFELTRKNLMVKNLKR